MAVLRKLGALADLFLKDQIARGQAAYESDLTRQRQEEVYNQKKNTDALASLGQLVDKTHQDPRNHPGFASLPEDIQNQLVQRYEFQPGQEQIAGEALDPIYKEMGGAVDAEHLGSQDSRLAQAKAALQSKCVELGSGDDNPMFAVEDAFKAQQSQIGANQKAADARTLQNEKDKAQVLYDINNPEEQSVFQRVDASGRAVGGLMVYDKEKQTYRPVTSADKIRKGAVHYIEGRENPYLAMGQGGGTIDDAAIDQWAKALAKGDPRGLPTLYGMSGNEVKKRIINRAAQYDPNTDSFSKSNTPVDLSANRVDFHAGALSVDQLTRNISAVEAFAKTADKNSALLENVMKQVPDVTTFLNTPVRRLSRAFGDPAMAAFNSARASVAAEYGRLTQNPNLTGPLTDKARDTIEAALPEDATAGQVKAALDLLRAESANRHQGFLEALQEAKGRMPGGNRTTAPTRGKLPAGVTVVEN